MNATELIKQPKIKSFLHKNFPKPKIVKPTLLTSNDCNTNGSLTGGAFETFLEIVLFKNVDQIKYKIQLDKNKILNSIKDILPNAKRNKKNLLKSKDYKLKKSLIKHILSSSTNAVIEYTHRNFDYFTIRSNSSPIIDQTSLLAFINNSINDFEIKGQLFFKTRVLTKEFVRLILIYSQLKSNFFVKANSKEIVEKFSFTAEYLGFVFQLFSESLVRYKLDYKKIMTKPRFHTYGIKATSDFLIDNKIIDTKTSKKFFSQRDYHQAIIYLLFAQTSENKKYYGEINSIILYYPRYNHQIIIHKSCIENKASFALKTIKAMA